MSPAEDFSCLSPQLIFLPGQCYSISRALDQARKMDRVSRGSV